MCILCILDQYFQTVIRKKKIYFRCVHRISSHHLTAPPSYGMVIFSTLILYIRLGSWCGQMQNGREGRNICKMFSLHVCSTVEKIWVLN